MTDREKAEEKARDEFEPLRSAWDGWPKGEQDWVVFSKQIRKINAALDARDAAIAAEARS